MKIDQSQFSAWKRDPVTIKIFSFLQAIKKDNELSLLNGTFLKQEGGLLTAQKLISESHLIEEIQNITLEDLEGKNDENETSGT